MKYLIVFLLAFGSLQATAQSSDPALDKRLAEYIKLNRDLNFSELVEYIHPSLFTLVPKEDIVTSYENAFNNEGVRITIDSLSINTINPVFVHNGGSYHKVNAHMGMSFYFKDEKMMQDSSFAVEMTSHLETMFPGKKVKFSVDRTYFILSGPEFLIAIKDDEKSQWMFLSHDAIKSDELKVLFPKEVVDHFGL